MPIEQNPDAPFKDDKFDRWGETARLLKACFTVINQYDLSKTTFQILSDSRIGPFERPDGFRHKLKTCFSKKNSNISTRTLSVTRFTDPRGRSGSCDFVECS